MGILGSQFNRWAIACGLWTLRRRTSELRVCHPPEAGHECAREHEPTACRPGAHDGPVALALRARSRLVRIAARSRHMPCMPQGKTERPETATGKPEPRLSRTTKEGSGGNGIGPGFRSALAERRRWASAASRDDVFTGRRRCSRPAGGFRRATLGANAEARWRLPLFGRGRGPRGRAA